MIRRSAISGDQIASLQRAALQDERLSFRARGILASVLSRPADWTTSAEQLARETPDEIEGGRGEGRKAILTALRELQKYGYLKRTKVQGEGGLWRTDWDLSDDPVDILPVDNSGGIGISAGHTDIPSRHVGPRNVGQRNVGQPTVGAGDVKQGPRDRGLETDIWPPSTGTSPGGPAEHGAAAEAGAELRDGYPRHEHEMHARAALTELVTEASLPLTATELVRFAYRVGAGNPWDGYLALKPALLATYPGARDLAAVIRSELGKLHPIRHRRAGGDQS